MNKSKLIVISGPTASGKTSLAIDIAKKFNGSIINADSRQFYIGMNIGTAKERIIKRNRDGSVNIQGVKHYLVDFLQPNEEYNLYKFQKDAFRAISEIINNKQIPIIVGGTGLYIDSVVYNYKLTSQTLDKQQRNNLQNMTVNELQKLVGEKNLKLLNNSDRNNPHRLIRTIEKQKQEVSQKVTSPSNYNYLYFFLKIDKNELNKRINKRVEDMFKQGLIEENKKLRDDGFSTKLNSMRSIGYQEFDAYFINNKDIDNIKELIKLHTRQYAKRQTTWFKRNKEIIKISSTDKAYSLISDFIYPQKT